MTIDIRCVFGLIVTAWLSLFSMMSQAEGSEWHDTLDTILEWERQGKTWQAYEAIEQLYYRYPQVGRIALERAVLAAKVKRYDLAIVLLESVLEEEDIPVNVRINARLLRDHYIQQQQQPDGDWFSYLTIGYEQDTEQRSESSMSINFGRSHDFPVTGLVGYPFYTSVHGLLQIYGEWQQQPDDRRSDEYANIYLQNRWLGLESRNGFAFFKEGPQDTHGYLDHHLGVHLDGLAFLYYAVESEWLRGMQAWQIETGMESEAFQQVRIKVRQQWHHSYDGMTDDYTMDETPATFEFVYHPSWSVRLAYQNDWTADETETAIGMTFPLGKRIQLKPEWRYKTFGDTVINEYRLRLRIRIL